MSKLTDVDKKMNSDDFKLAPGNNDAIFLRGLTVNQAQLARLFGVTKQAVHAWVRDGKIKIDAIGRIDPNQALTQLLSGSDPARLRCALLKPVRDEIERITAENKLLNARLSSAMDELEFQEGVADEVSHVLATLERRLSSEWDLLHGVEGRYAIAAISDWIEAASMRSEDTAKTLTHFLDLNSPARRADKKGEGDANNFSQDEKSHV